MITNIPDRERDLQAQVDALTEELERLRAQKDGAYLERNQCVSLIARMALALGCKAGVAKTAIEGWSDDWHGCVYIDLPTGQVSWHYHDSQGHLFDSLPAYFARGWDGHDTLEKYRRVKEAYAAAPPAQPATRKDCGEAGCAEGRCGNAGCLPSAQPAEPVQRLSDEQAIGTIMRVLYDASQGDIQATSEEAEAVYRAIESTLQPGWRDIESAPEGELVVVHWLDDEDSEYPDRHDFDMLEDGIWTQHADNVEYADMVAPPGSKMPPQKAPYTGWLPLPPEATK